MHSISVCSSIRRRWFTVLLASLCSLVCWCPLLHAQTTSASLSGTVLDPAGNVVTAAAVNAANIETSDSYATKSNAAGVYVLPALPAGRYQVTVMKPGFKQAILTELELHTQDTVSHNFHLEMGAISESVTVNGSGIEINTEDATVGTVVERQFVENVPLNGRSLQSLLTLVPGVATVPGSGQVGYQGEITVDGQRTESNYFTVDGVSANSGAKIDNETGGAGYSGAIPGMSIIGTTQSMVSLDDLEEFRAATSTYSADQGRTPGGQFAFTTRGGTNSWHGGLSEYFRNDDLDANNWFDGYCNPITDSNDCQSFTPFPKGAEKQNDFGGTLGGPVIIPHLYDGKNKTFFFFSYEGLRLIQPVPPSTWTVPDKAMRLAAPAVLQPFLNAYAIQNGGEMTQSPGLAFYNLVYSEPSNLDSTSVRIDHSFGDKLKIFGRYATTPSNGWYFNDLPIHDNIRANVNSITLGATGMITPTQTNELRFNYTYNDSGEFELASNFGGAVPISVGIVDGPNGQPLQPIGSQLTFRTYFKTGGKAEFELEGNDYSQNQYNITDTHYWTRGAHAFKFGVDWRYLYTYAVPSINKEEVEFGNEEEVLRNAPGVIENVPHSILKSEPAFTNFSAFAQDEWKATRRLSVSLGLRWDVNPPPGNRIGYLPYTLDQITNLATATLAPEDTPLWKTDWHGFAPRLGVAYRMGQNSGSETVLRAGAGLFYDLGSVYTSEGFSTYMGFDNIAQYSNDIEDNPNAPILYPFPLTPAQMTLPPVDTAPPYNESVLAFDPNLRLPYTLHWNVAIERQLGRSQSLTASYVASRGQDQLAELEYSPQALGNANFEASSVADVVSNRASSAYDSLQVKFQRDLAHGLQVLASYTWSHSIDNASSNFMLMELLRSSSDFDIRHNAQAAFTYDVPGRYSNPVLESLLKYWSVDSRISARSALPVDMVGAQNIDPITEANLNYEPSFVKGQPVYTSACTNPGQQTYTAPGGRCVNINAFTTALDANGNDINGNVPRNFLRGFDAIQFDLGMQREFAIVERLKLQFKAEAFNAFNHPQMGAVDGNITDGYGVFGIAGSSLNNEGSALSPLYASGGPRSIQLALKLAF